MNRDFSVGLFPYGGRYSEVTWMGEDLGSHSYRWLQPDLVPSFPVLKCHPFISWWTRDILGSQRHWLPFPQCLVTLLL